MNVRAWLVAAALWTISLGCVDSHTTCDEGCPAELICHQPTNLCVTPNDAGTSSADAGVSRDGGLTDAGTSRDAGADGGELDSGILGCAAGCAEYDECRGEVCAPRYARIDVVTPSRVNAAFVVTATLELSPGATARAPATLALAITQPGQPSIDTYLTSDGGAWVGMVSAFTSGVITATVRWPDAGLSGQSTTVVDLDAPTFDVSVAAPPSRLVVDGGPTYVDEGAPVGAAVWRRDEFAQITVRSREADVDPTQTQIRLGNTVIAHDGGCLVTGCTLSVDLSRPAFPMWRGTLPITVNGMDDLGNAAMRDGGAVFVTRHLWTAPTPSLSARPFSTFLAADPDGTVYFSTAAPNSGVMTLNADGTLRRFSPAGAGNQVATAPLPINHDDAGATSFYVGLNQGGNISLARLQRGGGVGLQTDSLSDAISETAFLFNVDGGSSTAGFGFEFATRTLSFDSETSTEFEGTVQLSGTSVAPTASGSAVIGAKQANTDLSIWRRSAGFFPSPSDYSATISNAGLHPFSRVWATADGGIAGFITNVSGDTELLLKTRSDEVRQALDAGLAIPLAQRNGEYWYGGHNLCRVSFGAQPICLPRPSTSFMTGAGAVLTGGQKLVVTLSRTGSDFNLAQIDGQTMTIDWEVAAGAGTPTIVSHVSCLGRGLGRIIGIEMVGSTGVTVGIIDQPGIDATADWATPAHDPNNTNNYSTSLAPWACP